MEDLDILPIFFMKDGVVVELQNIKTINVILSVVHFLGQALDTGQNLLQFGES